MVSADMFEVIEKHCIPQGFDEELDYRIHGRDYNQKNKIYQSDYNKYSLQKNRS